MTRTELASVDPVAVLREALYHAGAGLSRDQGPEAETILAAMPDYTIVRRADLEALRQQVGFLVSVALSKEDLTAAEKAEAYRLAKGETP